jgi:hypothetical protein
VFVTVTVHDNDEIAEYPNATIAKIKKDGSLVIRWVGRGLVTTKLKDKYAADEWTSVAIRNTEGQLCHT